MSLSDRFWEYHARLVGFGEPVVDRLLPPATDGELGVLGEFLEFDPPDELIEWYGLHNGIDRSGPPYGPWTYIMGFSLWSIEEAIEALRGLLGGQLQENPTANSYRPIKPFPVLIDDTQWAPALLVECEGEHRGRIVTMSDEISEETGLYHDSLEDFYAGCLAVFERWGHDPDYPLGWDLRRSLNDRGGNPSLGFPPGVEIRRVDPLPEHQRGKLWFLPEGSEPPAG